MCHHCHSGAKKSHSDWMVDQLADLFRTTHKVKTQQVVKIHGQYCGDIELPGYLVNEVDPVRDKERSLSPQLCHGSVSASIFSLL